MDDDLPERGQVLRPVRAGRRRGGGPRCLRIRDPRRGRGKHRAKAALGRRGGLHRRGRRPRLRFDRPRGDGPGEKAEHRLRPRGRPAPGGRPRPMPSAFPTLRLARDRQDRPRLRRAPRLRGPADGRGRRGARRPGRHHFADHPDSRRRRGLRRSIPPGAALLRPLLRTLSAPAATTARSSSRTSPGSDLSQGRDAVLAEVYGYLSKALDFTDFTVLIDDDQGFMRTVYSPTGGRATIDRGSKLCELFESSSSQRRPEVRGADGLRLRRGARAPPRALRGSQGRGPDRRPRRPPHHGPFRARGQEHGRRVHSLRLRHLQGRSTASSSSSPTTSRTSRGNPS